MVLSYQEIKKIAVENEKKLREKKKALTESNQAEEEVPVKKQSKKDNKDFYPDLPEYNEYEEEDYVHDVMHEHQDQKAPCEKCEKLRNAGNEQPDPK